MIHRDRNHSLEIQAIQRIKSGDLTFEKGKRLLESVWGSLFFTFRSVFLRADVVNQGTWLLSVRPFQLTKSPLVSSFLDFMHTSCH